MTYDVFQQKIGKTTSISATSTSASVTLDSVGAAAENLRVFNAGPNTVFITWGVGSATATTTTNLPIPAGGVENFFKGPGADTVAAICASTQTATVYFTPGEGV